MAHVEYLDVDTATDEAFMYYLKTRGFNTVNMLEDYATYFGVPIPVVINGDVPLVADGVTNLVYMDTYVAAFQALIGDPISTTRLTDTEAKDYLNFMKYKRSSQYSGLSAIVLDRIDFGKNLLREATIHWNLFLEDFGDCEFQYLQNGAERTDGLILVNFPCPYDEDLSGIATTKTDFNVYVGEFVAEGDKKKKERVCFKTFLKNYLPVNNNKLDIQNAFYADLISDSIHTHDKGNVISRLVKSKRYQRRVLLKLPPYA